MEDNLVTIATFNQIIDAHIAKSKLEAEGIEVFLINEDMTWLYANVIGAQLQVKESKVDQALEILNLDE